MKVIDNYLVKLVKEIRWNESRRKFRKEIEEISIAHRYSDWTNPSLVGRKYSLKEKINNKFYDLVKNLSPVKKSYNKAYGNLA